MMGADRALEGSTQAWALRAGPDRTVPAARVPRAHARITARGRRRSSSARCFPRPSASIGERAYIGPRCHLGWAHHRARRAARRRRARAERREHARHRRSVDPDPRSADHQDAGPDRRRRWIGSAAVVMADVGRDCGDRGRRRRHATDSGSHDRRRRSGARPAASRAAPGERLA